MFEKVREQCGDGWRKFKMRMGGNEQRGCGIWQGVGEREHRGKLLSPKSQQQMRRRVGRRCCVALLGLRRYG